MGTLEDQQPELVLEMVDSDPQATLAEPLQKLLAHLVATGLSLVEVATPVNGHDVTSR